MSNSRQYQTKGTSFFTTFYNLNWSENGRIPVEEVADRVNSSVKKFGVNEEMFGVNEEMFGVNEEMFGVNEKVPSKSTL